jgi:uncharacterized Fe-S center protein
MEHKTSKPAPVYHADMRTKEGSNLLDKTKRVFLKAGLASCIEKNDLVAIKMHWGEVGNLAYVAPALVRAVVEEVRRAGGKPFLTDTNTLYRGGRRNAVDHIMTAYKNGFSIGSVDAPVIVADGLKGLDYQRVKGTGTHFKELKIGSAIYNADALIVLSHVKGHLLLGFGGAIKNLGMGCASPAGKQAMHSDLRPKVKPSICIGCGTCERHCPTGAVRVMEDGKAFVDQKRCIGCGECTSVCPTEAIPIRWKTDARAVQEKTAEYALAALSGKEGKSGFINFLMHIGPDCDCFSWNDAAIVPDLGILASKDPVAIDQASVDLINQAPGIPLSKLGHDLDVPDKIHKVTGVQWDRILIYGEEIGLGTRAYRLVKVD